MHRNTWGMDQGRQDGLKRDIPGATIDARVVRRVKGGDHTPRKPDDRWVLPLAGAVVRLKDNNPGTQEFLILNRTLRYVQVQKTLSLGCARTPSTEPYNGSRITTRDLGAPDSKSDTALGADPKNLVTRLRTYAKCRAIQRLKDSDSGPGSP